VRLRAVARSAALAVALALVLSACGGGPGTGDGSSGIRGTAHVGPQCPVVQAGSPCPDAPFDGEIRVSTPDGDEVTTAPTGDGGSFEIALEPGTYVVDVVVENPGGPPFAKPVTVEVESGSFAVVDVAVDSGIR
jgi:hypothetical protein